MKNFKKVMCVVLTVVMVMSALSLAAFAHTFTGAEEAAAVNVKLEVTQVPSVTLNDGTGTYTAVDNDIYAVTIYAKAPANTGIMVLQVPIQFDGRKFSPAMTLDGTDLYTPAMYDENTWTTDIGTVATAYKLPDRFSDTNAYDNSGVVQTSSIKIKSFALGNASAGTWAFQSEWVGPDDGRYAAWTAGLDTNSRIVFVCLDDTSLTAKTAYLNTDKGQLLTDQYVEMATVYFQRNAGVSEADALANSFGIASADNFGTQLTSRTTNAAFPASYAAAHTNPKLPVNYVENAKTARVSALATLTATGAAAQQIKFNGTTANDTVDYRFVAQFSKTMFDLQYDAALKVTSTNIAEVGFVLANTASAKTYADLTAFTGANITGTAQGAEIVTGIRKCATANISTTTAGGANFAFSARITGIGVADGTVASEYVAVPYVVLTDGTVYFGSSLLTSNIQGRYDTYKTAAGIA